MSGTLSKQAHAEGLDAFTEAVRKRRNPEKAVREVMTGKFAVAGPLDDPRVFDHQYRALVALRDLREPLEDLTRGLAATPGAGAAHFLALQVKAFHRLWALVIRDAIDPHLPPSVGNPWDQQRVWASYAHLSPEERALRILEGVEKARREGLLEMRQWVGGGEVEGSDDSLPT